ncbi:MAG: hypothetical protein LBJ76_00080, partial [Candidatus Accumulibacter sp.]|nr:hypothetical protein [Accumulibacter sp.]
HKQEAETDSIRAWHYYGAKTKIEGEEYLARLVVREDVNGNIYYDGDLSSVEKIASDGVSRTKSGASSVTGDPHTLAQWCNSVNPDAVSKVIDPDTGEPRVVYHGTNSDFEVFDRKKLGASTKAKSAAKGFFFVDQEIVARGYSLNSALNNQGSLFGQQNSIRMEYEKAVEEKTDERISDTLKAVHIARERYEEYARNVSQGVLSPQEAYKRLAAKSPIVTQYKDSILDDYSKVHNTGKKDFSYSGNFIYEPELSELKNKTAKQIQEEIRPIYEEKSKEIFGKTLIQGFLNIRNPKIKDFQGEEYRDETYADILKQARKERRDGAILKNTFDGVADYKTEQAHNVFVALKSNQIKFRSCVPKPPERAIPRRWPTCVPQSTKHTGRASQARSRRLGY